MSRQASFLRLFDRKWRLLFRNMSTASIPSQDLITPRSIRLEASTACQLQCPLCSTGKGEIAKTIGTGVLRFHDFKKLVDANPWVRDIELSSRGEIFLNKELLSIIRYAHQRHVALRADGGVNFNTVSDEVLEALVKYQFRSMKCAIDGASQETYRKYRKGGDFETVLLHIRRLNEFKARHGSPFPKLTWQFVAFGHNEHEIALARQRAKDLNMDFWLKLSWDETFSPIQDEDSIRREAGLGVASRTEYYEKYGDKYLETGICSQLWKRPQINWDGKVLGCCRNIWGDFGNAFQEGLVHSFNNPKIAYARRMLLGKAPPRKDIPCTTCPAYHTRKRDQRWLTMEKINAVSTEIQTGDPQESSIANGSVGHANL